jgi:hypothetical protein
MLGRGKVEAASHALRHHLEYVSRHLPISWVQHRLFVPTATMTRRTAAERPRSHETPIWTGPPDAAQSWANTSAKETAAQRKEALANSNAATNVDQWAVNKAVHYNEWANFGKKDFEPVVAAFKELLECFHCDKCQSWLYVTPRQRPESLRCVCNAVNLNLLSKPS